EAYLGGGLPAIIELERVQLIDARTTNAWRMIDEGERIGDQALLSEALLLMVDREQNETIRESWDRLYARASGPLLTGLISMVGQSSIPGTRTYSEVLPRRGEASAPIVLVRPGLSPPIHVGDVEAGASAILPDGNISFADDRFRYITTE